MDFVGSLPRTIKDFDAIRVIIDKLVKSVQVFFGKSIILDHLGCWDEVSPLVEFTYNNSFHTRIGMTSFEALYSRRWRELDRWTRTNATNNRDDQKDSREQLRTEVGKAIKFRKLPPKFIEPYQILHNVGLVAHNIVLPHLMSNIHNLKKHTCDSTHMIEHDTLQIQENLTFEEHDARAVLISLPM
ncbi:hypothetical protein CR513_08190, partial [Mucuna pruriens]